MTLEDIQELTKSVDGFLSQNGKNLIEGEVLYHLASRSKGKIVEIGSWKGKSTIWLAKGTEAGHKQKVYAVDPHTGSEEHRADGRKVWTFDTFQENISHANVASTVVPIVKPSLEGIYDVPGRIGLVFIDGAHDYESVKRDFEAWIPKVALGGRVAFHDSFGIGWPGVRKLVHNEVFKSPFFKNVCYINNITYAEKCDQTTLRDRFNNRIALWVKIIHEWSLDFPQPFRSLVKRLIWHPFHRRWVKNLMR